MLSFQLLGGTELLVVLPPKDNDIRIHRPSSGQPVGGHVRPKRLAIHSLRNLMDAEAERICTYELPVYWNHATVDIRPNTSPISESHVASGTMFYPDPARRIVVLVAVFSLEDPPLELCRRELIVLREKSLRTNDLGCSTNVPWDRWSPYCYHSDISPSNRPPHVVGTRIFYLEDVPVPRHSLRRRHVHLLDFNPYAPIQHNTAPRMVQGLGPWRTVTTEERHRALPCIRTRTLDHYEISELYATADNLILLVVCRSFSRHRDRY